AAPAEHHRGGEPERHPGQQPGPQRGRGQHQQLQPRGYRGQLHVRTPGWTRAQPGRQQHPPRPSPPVPAGGLPPGGPHPRPRPPLAPGDPSLAGTSAQRGVPRPANAVNIGASQPNSSLPTASIGTFDPATATFYLRNATNAGAPDAGVIPFGLPNWKPVAGNW